jgi:hypothetical protein
MEWEQGEGKGSKAAVRRVGSGGVRRARRKIVNSESSSTERELYYPDLNEYRKL